jgi:hypothetical protein
MSSFRIRPRFSQTLDLEPDKVQARIVDYVEGGGERPPGSRVEVKNFPGYVTLRIPEEDQHFWSPLLNLSLESVGEGRTVIHGIYGPNTNVWAIFLYGYLLIGSLALFAGLFGISQWAVGVKAWGLVGFAVLSGLLIGLYLLAQFGQKLAARQTYLLHLTYEAAVGRAVEIH